MVSNRPLKLVIPRAHGSIHYGPFLSTWSPDSIWILPCLAPHPSCHSWMNNPLGYSKIPNWSVFFHQNPALFQPQPLRHLRLQRRMHRRRGSTVRLVDRVHLGRLGQALDVRQTKGVRWRGGHLHSVHGLQVLVQNLLVEIMGGMGTIANGLRVARVIW